MSAFLDDYTMIDEIGSGGYATVYKVRHNQLDYIRAIRVLDKTISSTKDALYLKFIDECKLLLRLGNGNHPNIVHIYQPLLRANKALVEMDFIDGEDLTHYLKKKKFIEIDDVLRLVEEISSALAYCHHEIYKFCYDKERDNLEDDPNDGIKPYINDEIEKRLVEKYRVIHNDIHSGNIMRRENGHYVLLDFGLAIEGSDIIRSSKRRNGAPEYKSPEKWDNENIISAESDIYSFGIVLYEFLTGKVPFPYNQQNSSHIAEHELYTAHMSKNPPSIFEERKKCFEKLNPGKKYIKDYPNWLESIILKCLNKKAIDRFKSGLELYSFVKSEIDKFNKSFKLDYDSKTELNNKLIAENKRLKKEIALLKEELKHNDKNPSKTDRKDVNVLINSKGYELLKQRKYKEAKRYFAVNEKNSKMASICSELITLEKEKEKGILTQVNRIRLDELYGKYGIINL